MNRFTEFLKAVAPYVVLCGSYAREEHTPLSDLDFYVRQKPQDPDEEPPVDTSYLPDIIQIVREFGYDFDSCVIGSITLSSMTTSASQVEFSSLYRLPISSPIGVRVVHGILFLTCEDDKTAHFSDCYESDDEENILPSYEEEIEKFREHGAI